MKESGIKQTSIANIDGNTNSIKRDKNTRLKGLFLDQFLPYRLSVAANKVSSAIQNIYFDRFSLSIPEWRVLSILATKGNMTARELTQNTAMDKVRISRAVKGLSNRDYILKIRHNSDGRSIILSLTQTGRSVFKDVEPLALEYEKKLSSTFTSEEWSILKELLIRVENEVATISASPKF